MAYQYGGFTLSDGVNYYVLAKQFDLPDFKQTYFPVARYPGVKKTGERLNEKQIPVTIKVVGASRADLESKLDTLYQALTMRQQNLTLHALDGRYYVADAIAGKAQLVPGRVISAEVPVTFVCLQPFAFAAIASTNLSTNLGMALVTGQTTLWQLAGGNNPYLVASSGNYYSWPTISIINQTTGDASTLSTALVQGNAYTSLSVAALPAAAPNGAVFLLVSGTSFQRVTLTAAAAIGATSLTVANFFANFAYPVGAFCGLDNYIQGFTLAQDPDGQVLTVTGLGVQQIGTGAALIITGDPNAPNGFNITPSNSSTPLGFTGAFPTMEPGQNSFALQVTCSNPPTVQLQFNWTPRWLS